MGLMTDELHETKKAHVELMVEVANGTVSLEVLGRYIVTYYPDEAHKLPEHMRYPLTPDEKTTLSHTVARRNGPQPHGDIRPAPTGFQT